jgi:hypothetical protein
MFCSGLWPLLPSWADCYLLRDPNRLKSKE